MSDLETAASGIKTPKTEKENWGKKSTGKSATLAFLCIVLFLDAMSVGLILPVMPALILSLSDLPVSRAAEFGGYLLFAFAGMQFLFAPILGGLSDRFGRRPVLLIALLGFAIDYFVMAFAPSLFWLFVARLISGICGATFPAANASIVDISAPEERARNFGLSGAAIGLGFIFGPVLGGVLGEYGATLPFIAAGFITAGAGLYGFFALRETLPPEKRRTFDWKRANPFGSIISISRNNAVALVLLAIFLTQLASQSYHSIWAFFTIELFDWTPFKIAMSVALYGLLMAIVQGVLTGPAVKRFGELRVGSLSIVFGFLAYVGLGFTSTAPQLFFWVVIGAMGGFSFPAMQALMTKNTDGDAQGELQGAVASAYSLSAIIGPIIMTQTFGAYTKESAPYAPGAPFFLAAGLIVFCLIFFRLGAGRLISDQTPPTTRQRVMTPSTPNQGAIEKAAKTLRHGGLVALPTETVYGLAADATNDTAVARIFEAKGRPRFNPLIVHFADRHDIAAHADISPTAQMLMDAFWPGPLTIVMPRKKESTLSLLVSAGLDTVAVRMPAHDTARAVINTFGNPIAAPSANRSGSISPTTADHVRNSLSKGVGARVDYVLDDGPCKVGVESTIVKVDGETVTLLRAGGLPREMIEETLGRELSAPSGKIEAPGMMTSHYAPSSKVRLNITAPSPNEAYLAFGPLAAKALETTHVRNLSPTGNLIEAAANLFAYLHELDALCTDKHLIGIAVAPVPAINLGEAINDRLTRAAAPA